MSARTCNVVIVDYGLGNLFSVRHACMQVGLVPTVTNERSLVETADAIFLPGVGAFGDAMDQLHRLDLVSPLRDLAAAGKPFIGICLGQQLLMTESEEFGRHAGLNLIPGSVVRFSGPHAPSGRPLKVPQVGWNRIEPPPHRNGSWSGTPLEGLPVGCHQYFVHSFHVVPATTSAVLARSFYGQIEFASALKCENMVSFQFHPERSGPQGLAIYRNLARWIAGWTGVEGMPCPNIV